MPLAAVTTASSAVVAAAPAAVRRGRVVVALLLLAFAATMWWAVPHGIGFSWRECDTQAIARNFLQDGFDPLRPRIDWRGDSDGAVESEFPLYQLAIASVMAFVGEVEWPGRLLSLLATLLAAVALQRLLEARCGPAGAIAGVATFLASGSTFLCATRVMPDAFSTALGTCAVVAFVGYLANGSSRTLWLSAAALAFAALQKPLALQLGLVMFGWTCVEAPRRLREPRLWAAFAVVLAVVASWLLHRRALHEQTGLTFGVLAAGDSKFPTLDNLLSPYVHARLALTTLVYGATPLGAAAVVALLFMRRLRATDVVLLLAVAIGLLVSLRYSYHHRMGPHYHAWAAVAGAFYVARVMPARPRPLLWLSLALAVSIQAGSRLAVERQERTVMLTTPLLELARELRELAEPGDLMVLHADKPRVDARWQRRNNFEDPRLFYQARLHGWVLPRDGFDVDSLTSLQRRGARLVCDPVPGEQTPEVRRWLAEHGQLVLAQAGFEVHRLHTTP